VLPAYKKCAAAKQKLNRSSALIIADKKLAQISED
jgi:hypothetical protein